MFINFKITVEPNDMLQGNITSLKITKCWLGDGDNAPVPEIETLEINPQPFKDLDQITKLFTSYYETKTAFEQTQEELRRLIDQSARLKEEYETSKAGIESLIKRPSIAETAERLRQEKDASLTEQEERRKKEEADKLIILSEKPAHTEMPKEEKLPEPETPRQQAERIYDKVFSELKGKKVEKEDIMAAVMRAGTHIDNLQQVTEEIINLLKEKGAIPSPKGTLKKLLGGGKKGKKEEKK